jgi:hypothetical protein
MRYQVSGIRYQVEKEKTALKWVNVSFLFNAEVTSWVKMNELICDLIPDT